MVNSLWVIGAIFVVSVVGGCARQQPAQAPAPPEEGVVEVRATLTDFKIEASQTEFETGTRYRFVVTNRGAVNHEFMITLPMRSGMSMERLHEMALLEIEEDELPPGVTKTIDYVFTEPATAGKLEFACHVEGHYEAGMRLPIAVKWDESSKSLLHPRYGLRNEPELIKAANHQFRP